MVRLIRLLDHGKLKNLNLYMMTEEHDSGAVHVIKAVRRFMNQRVYSFLLSDTLFVYFHNCTKENKIWNMFVFLEGLLLWDILNNVEFGFLPFDHTHEEVDRAFSKAVNRKCMKNAVILLDFHDVLQKSFDGAAKVNHLEQLVN